MEETGKTLLDVNCLSGPVPYPLVEVVWDDAAVDGGWDKVKEPKAELVLTVGFLTSKGPDHIIVSNSICSGEYGTNGRIQIPLGMIKSLKEM
jgi:hypothetical protein